MLDLIRCAVKNIFRRRSRAMITVLGIAIGMCSVVLVSAVGDVGKNMIELELNGLGAGSLTVSADKAVSNATIGEEEVQVLSQIDGVAEVSPMAVEYTYVSSNQGNTNAVVWGVGAQNESAVKTELIYGRQLDSADQSSASRVCLVDESYAKEVLGHENPVGDTVKIKFSGLYETFEIVGVVRSGGNMMQGLMTQYVPSFFYIPESAMRELTGKTDYSQVWVKLEDGIDRQKAGGKIQRILNAHSDIPGEYYVQDVDEQKQGVSNVLSIVTTVLSCVAGISLVVAGLSIMTVMLVSVSERVREIGIKKSIGASRSTTLFEFFTEALLLSLIGGVSGCFAGVVLSAAGCALVGVSVIINWKLIVFCILFSLGLGALFGLYPAIKASGLHPVDALRKE